MKSGLLSTRSFLHSLVFTYGPVTLSLVICFFLNFLLFKNIYSPWMMVGWFISIGLLLFCAVPYLGKLRTVFALKNTGIALVVLLPIVVRVALYNLNRFHGDDLITGYFSAHYDLWKTNFFGPVPPGTIYNTDWVCQFPSLYFFLQKMFFVVFGESILSVKLSVLPYIAITSLILFLIGRELFDRTTGVIAVILYSFLAISLYLDTLGLHFASSTAIFIVFFYLALKYFHRPHFIWGLFTGLSLGLCYLFYSSSYIAIGVWGVFLVLVILKHSFKEVMQFVVLSAIGCFIVLSPFLAYMKVSDNLYLTQRAEQVSLGNGSWSYTGDRMKKGEKLVDIYKMQLRDSLRSMHVDGVGGAGGYDFRQLAMFDTLTLGLFIAGLIVSAGLVNKKLGLLAVYSAVLAGFLLIVVTIPPPAYHRFSVVFPFITLVVAVFFHFILSHPQLQTRLKWTVVVAVIIIFVWKNLQYFRVSTQTELINQHIKVMNYITEHYPERRIHIAAYPGFAFEKYAYFISHPRAIDTDYHDNYVKKFNTKEKYLYIIHNPGMYGPVFQEKDKNGRIIEIVPDYSLFVK